MHHSINTAICLISSSIKPLDVTAGVPNLNPEVVFLFSVSKGTAFLLDTIPTFSNLVSNSLPVIPLFFKSNKIK